LSFFRMKYGRLTGFGLSMFAACLYWFYLFFMHTRAIITSANPMLYLWAPNVTVFILGSILLWRLYKR
ncbi:MAG: LptF/LptG family permease, partial [Spirochaetales bacterium]